MEDFIAQKYLVNDRPMAIPIFKRIFELGTFLKFHFKKEKTSKGVYIDCHLGVLGMFPAITNNKSKLWQIK